VYNAGFKKVGRFVQVFCRPNRLKGPRFGISVSARLGNAVLRNHVKRWVREAIRKNKTLIESGLDIVVQPKPGVLTADQRAIEKELKDLLLLASINHKGNVAIFDESSINRTETV